MNEPVNKTEHILTGVVTKNKMQKTVVVEVERQVKHAVYGKILRRSIKLHVDDPANACQVGDKVKVQSCRPISKAKSWKLVDIVEKAQ